MDRIEKIILHFLQKKANLEELKELNEWSGETANNRKLIDYLKLWLWSGQIEQKQPRVEFSNTWQKINNTQTLPKSNIINLRLILRYAAMIFILLNIGWWGSRSHYNTKLNSEVQLFEVSANQTTNSLITLPDQTLVYLRPGSSLHYDSHFNENHREVLLDGEAYFEVNRNEKSPFTVLTDKAQIKVFGTKFNVLAETKSAIYQTTLVEGKVEFQTNNGKTYLLQPNQMIELNIKNNTVQIKQVNTDLYTAWKDGKVIFRDESLGEITKKLEKIYHVKFIYKNKELSNKYRFSGTFHYETSIGEIITMLKISMPMKVIREERFPEPDIIYLE